MTQFAFSNSGMFPLSLGRSLSALSLLLLLVRVFLDLRQSLNHLLPQILPHPQTTRQKVSPLPLPLLLLLMSVETVESVLET